MTSVPLWLLGRMLETRQGGLWQPPRRKMSDEIEVVGLVGKVKVVLPIECPMCHAPLRRVWWRYKTWRCRNRSCGWAVQIRVVRRRRA